MRYTVEPGRQIYKDGKEFIHIGNEGLDPCEADEMTRIICKLLNFRNEFVTE